MRGSLLRADGLFRKFPVIDGCSHAYKSASLSDSCAPTIPERCANRHRHPTGESRNCAAECVGLSAATNRLSKYAFPACDRCFEWSAAARIGSKKLPIAVFPMPSHQDCEPPAIDPALWLRSFQQAKSVPYVLCPKPAGFLPSDPSLSDRFQRLLKREVRRNTLFQGLLDPAVLHRNLPEER